MLYYTLDDGSRVDYVPSNYTGCVSFINYSNTITSFWYFRGNWHRTDGPTMVYTKPKNNKWYLHSTRVTAEDEILLVLR